MWFGWIPIRWWCHRPQRPHHDWRPIPHPDFSLNMSWRGFDFSATMNGWREIRLKSYRSFVDYRAISQWYSATLGGDSTSNSGRGSHREPPPIGSTFRPVWKTGDYLRKNITIGYDFQKLFNPFRLQEPFYFSANNLFTITGYSGMDPESGLRRWWRLDIGHRPRLLSSPRTYIFGVNIKIGLIWKRINIIRCHRRRGVDGGYQWFFWIRKTSPER